MDCNQCEYNSEYCHACKIGIDCVPDIPLQENKHWFDDENKPIGLYKQERQEVENIIFSFIDKIIQKCKKLLH